MVKNESALFSLPTLGQRRTEFKLNGDWKPPFLIVTMDQMYYEQRAEVSKAIFLGLYSVSEEATGKKSTEEQGGGGDIPDADRRSGLGKHGERCRGRKGTFLYSIEFSYETPAMKTVFTREKPTEVY